MIRSSNRIALFVAVVFLLTARGWAQEQAKPDQGAEEKLVIKVYRVLDLVSPAPNYPYEGTYLPGGTRSAGSLSGAGLGGAGTGGGGMGGMGGGMGGMGGGMGGGMFRVRDELAQRGGTGGGSTGTGTPPTTTLAANTYRASAMRIESDQLIEAITSIVEPLSWEDGGGEGRIELIGGALAIRQTAAIQAKVQEFLDALRRESGTLRSLSVKARWLVLDNDQLTALTSAAKTDKQSVAGQVVNREALAALPAEAKRYSGQITCFNGQTVHIISGQIETVVQGAIPVVGGTNPAYQPVVLTPHLGVLLQFTPSVMPGEDAVMMDLQSYISRWDEPGTPVQLYNIDSKRSALEIDRMKVAAQQFATSIRVPLNRPTLVGGMTFPANEPGKQEGELYLVIEVHSNPGT